MPKQINRIKISDNFSLHEFACPCCGMVKVHPRLLEALEKLRVALAQPIPIEQGCRCRAYHFALYYKLNKDRIARGLPALEIPEFSKHLEGLAVDLRITPKKDDIPTYKSCGFKGIGIGKHKLHLDVRKGPYAYWEYD